MFSPEKERIESREKQESTDIFSNSLTISEEVRSKCELNARLFG